MTLQESVREFCFHHGSEKTYWVAYSGGFDSHVLLSLCVELRNTFPIKFRAIHINHGVSPNAEKWSMHCAYVCERVGIDYVERTIKINLSPGKSLEEAAREKRYAIFAEYLSEGDILLTAHQQDDQAETVLLQLMRGAGPKGLAAMPVIKPFARGFHGRPLLNFPRTALQQYADERQLKWIDDESNFNVKLTRNYIRHEILPLLKKRWPAVTNTISRSAAHCAEAQVLLEEFAVEERQKVKGSHDFTLSVEKLLQLDSARQRLILRSWIQQLEHPIPDARKIESIINNVLTAAWDRLPCISWKETELRRYRDDLYLMVPLSEHDTQKRYSWDLIKPLALSGIGVLHSSSIYGRGLRADIKQVSVRFRQGGEIAALPERGCHTLKNLLQEWDVLPWERNRIPLIFVEKKLAAAVGYFIDDNYAAKNNEQGVELTLEKIPLDRRGIGRGLLITKG